LPRSNYETVKAMELGGMKLVPVDDLKGAINNLWREWSIPCLSAGKIAYGYFPWQAAPRLIRSAGCVFSGLRN